MSRAFGKPLGDVRIHTDSRAAQLADRQSAAALTIGTDIAFAPGRFEPGSLEGDVLLAHEVAHALQFREDDPALSESAAEDSADAAAIKAAGHTHGREPSTPMAALPIGGLALRRCSRTRAQRAFDGEIPWTPAIAQEALDAYNGMSEPDRQRAFERYYPTGAFHRLLTALPPGAAAGPYNAVVQDVLRRAQRAGALQSAASSGLAGETEMAQAQADFMQSANEAVARAARPVGPPPSTAEVAAQQSGQVSRTSIAPAVSALTPAEVANWTTRANAAVATLVAYAAARHPELLLSAADFLVDVVAIEGRGRGVIAFGSVAGGRNVAVVGRTFVEYVDANPAYAMSVVFHELHGHPEYGPYGSAGSEYALTIYDRAAARMPGYTRPTGDARKSEIDAYAYQETEIYSLLRSMPYHTPLAAADAALQSRYVDPEPTVSARIGLIKQQWEPRVAKALLRGLYQRLRLDPRITPDALHAFERGVRANYTGGESSTAGDILR